MKLTNEPGYFLVIDDNKVNRILLLRSLEQLGHRVEMAENGKQGLEKLRSQSFDLVLLDIEMPEMDGYQVLETCMNDVELRQIPIIMTTAMDELDSVVKCIELGAEDYLIKPVNPVLLRARVNASLEKKRLRDEQRKLFRTFATKEVAEDLLRTGFSLGGKYVNATVLFSDIRSFTTIAESQPPAETIDMLNGYFALMIEAVNSHGGMINQMLGDGLMAIFGSPVVCADHNVRAVQAAMEMLDMLAIFNQEQIVRGKPSVRIGVGIASGRMIAGYTGTQSRAVYTCVGDTVNLASRIEDYTKQAGRSILISESTNEGLPPEIQTELLGAITFKGKNQAVNVFAVRSEMA